MIANCTQLSNYINEEKYTTWGKTTKTGQKFVYPVLEKMNTKNRKEITENISFLAILLLSLDLY